MKKNYFKSKLPLAVLMLFFTQFVTSADKYWNGSGTWNTSTADMWGTTDGTYNTIWVNYDNAIFNVPNSIVTVGSTVVRVSGFTANENVTITAGSAFMCATGLNAFIQAPINVASGKVLDFGTQGLQTTNASGLQLNGPGEFATGCTAGYTGGFTLNSGTVTCKASNALGAGALNINGGTLAASTDVVLNSSSIAIGNNFTLGATTNIATPTSNISFNKAGLTIDLGNTGGPRIITLGGTGIYILKGVISGSNGLTVAETVAGGTLSLENTNTYTGGTIINGGLLRIGETNAIPAYGVTLGGGSLRTGIGAGAGFSNALGTLTLTENSIINFNSGDHSLTCSDSHSIAWTAGKTLTINGWTGTSGVNGGSVEGKLIVGVGGLNSSQLAQINFTGYDSGAVITPSGEVVPVSGTTTAVSSEMLNDKYFSVTRNGIVCNVDGQLQISNLAGQIIKKINVVAGEIVSLQKGSYIIGLQTVAEYRNKKIVL